MTSQPNGLDYYREMRAGIDAKLAALPSSSFLRAALPKERLDAAFASADRQVEETGGSASTLVSFPPLVLFCDRRSDTQLAALEDDLQRVVRHSKSKSPAEVTQFLKVDIPQDREWCGGLFEVAVKARLLRIPGPAVELDVPLPNGREADALVQWKGKTFSLECTVITESDEDREAWDRFVAAQNAGEATVMVRPGAFDAENARSPSPYYDTVRVYDKVYDKLAKRLDPRQSQFAPDTPSVLLLSVWSPRAPLDSYSPGVRWALDELFADQPRKRTIAPGESGIDIALGGWIDYKAKELQAKGKLTTAQYAGDLPRIIAAPRGLGGILVFDGYRLTAARVNYNAERAYRLSHHEMSHLETWSGGEPYWA